MTDFAAMHRFSHLTVATTVFVAFASVLVKDALSMSVPFETPPDGLQCDDNYTIKVTHNDAVINSTLRKNGHCAKITVALEAFGQSFELDMELNRYLFAEGFVQKSVTRNGDVYHPVNHTTEHCFYVGTVRNYPGSMAAVSTCSGIVGYFAIGHVSYHIDPRCTNLNDHHKVCRSQGDSKTSFKRGVDESYLDHFLSPANQRKRFKRSFSWPQDIDKNKVIELYVANDRSQYVSLGNDTNEVYGRTKLIVNISSTTFQPLGIYLALVGVEVWVDFNRIRVNASDPNSTLSQWSSYRMTLINPFDYNDIGILITNIKFANNVIGKANPGGMCSDKKSAAFVSDSTIYPSYAASVLNREIGHSFNLTYDDDYTGPCPCDDPFTHRCIMSSNIDVLSPSKIWSQCSMDQLNLSFSHGFDICLYNIPPSLFQPTPICGNGIVEAGEQCDCGNFNNQQCNKTCCDPITCKLMGSATCAYGKCCDISTCQILPCGTTCRPKAGECDLAEYCTGQDAVCPNDTHKPDGTNCTNRVAAYCYDGLCNSRESQCELLWGPGTLVSDDICFTKLNVAGKLFGNCGINRFPIDTYIACQDSDVLCGILQCQDNSSQRYYYKQIYQGAWATVNGSSCRSVIFDFGLKVQDPGLVPNGASCGTGSMCLNQACVNVSNVTTTPCATSCQQDEMCNNLGQCQSTTGNVCPQTTTVQKETSAQVPTTTVILQQTTSGQPTTKTLPQTTSGQPTAKAMQSTRAPSTTIGQTTVSIRPISNLSTDFSTEKTPNTTTPTPRPSNTDIIIISSVLAVVIAAVGIVSVVLCCYCCCPEALHFCCPCCKLPSASNTLSQMGLFPDARSPDPRWLSGGKQVYFPYKM